MHDQGLTYELRKSGRARRLSIVVHPDCRVVVTAPLWASVREVTEYVRRYEEWVRRQVRALRRYEDHIFLPSGRREYLRHKETARDLARRVLAVHAPAYGIGYGRIAIKNLRANWGSCSEKGNLNFNYRIALIPFPLAEYIIVHELCHRVHFDHSPRFWDLVARAVPDHKERRKTLRKYLI